MGPFKWLKNLGSNTLYFPGCMTKTLLKEEFENYKEIFRLLDIPFILLSDKEICCGMPVLNAGYRKESRTIAKKNLEVFKKNNISKIIASCANCYYMFKEVYPTLLKEWDIDVEHASVSILEGLERNRINLGNSSPKDIVIYHDSCYLSRRCNIVEEPRKVITLLGGKVLEMKSNKKDSMCCGAAGGIINNFPDLAKKSATFRINESPNKDSKIISACSLCHYNLKSVSDRSMEFSTFVLNKLKNKLN